MPLDQFSIVSPSPHSAWRTVALATPGVLDASMRVLIVESISGYAAAVASAGPEWTAAMTALEESGARSHSAKPERGRNPPLRGWLRR